MLRPSVEHTQRARPGKPGQGRPNTPYGGKHRAAGLRRCQGGMWLPISTRRPHVPTQRVSPERMESSAKLQRPHANCRKGDIRLQAGAHTVAGWCTYGCRLVHIGLQPGTHRAAAWCTYGCSLACTGLQPESSGLTRAHLYRHLGGLDL